MTAPARKSFYFVVLLSAVVDWLKEIIREGHRVGNHTCDHVYLLAGKPEKFSIALRVRRVRSALPPLRALPKRS